MPEEAFNCEKMEVITTPYPSDPGKNTLLTAVSSVVGAMIIVVLAMTIGGLYFRRKNQHRNWFYFNARRSSDCDNQAANDDENHNEFEYDAFVSFNEQDRPWVYTHLVPKLETPKESASATDFGNFECRPVLLACYFLIIAFFLAHRAHSIVPPVPS